jgi:putative DNA primase/helicase
MTYSPDAQHKISENDMAGYVVAILTGKLTPKQDRDGKWWLGLGSVAIEVHPNDDTEDLARLTKEALEEFVVEDDDPDLIDPPRFNGRGKFTDAEIARSYQLWLERKAAAAKNDPPVSNEEPSDAPHGNPAKPESEAANHPLNPVNPRLVAALEYIERGWDVFLAPPGKKKSYKSAEYSGGAKWGKTRDPEQIKKDFKRWPKANIGIPTGADNKIWVLETDTPKGHNVDGNASLRMLEEKHGPLPETLMAESPSGSRHRCFKWPDAVAITNSTSSIGPGIDVRGEGGMVIAPPSVRDDGAYRWLNDNPIADAPQWLIDLAGGKGADNSELGLAQKNVDEFKAAEEFEHLDPDEILYEAKTNHWWDHLSGEQKDAALDHGLELIAKNSDLLKFGNNENWYRIVTTVVRSGAPHRKDIFVKHARAVPGADSEEELRKKLAYCEKNPRGITVGTFIHWAKQCGANFEPWYGNTQPEENKASISNISEPVGKKTIRIVKGEIARMVDEAEVALLAVADTAPIMVRAGMLVQPIVDQLPASHGRMTQVVLLRPLTNANIIYLLNKHAAIFWQYDGRRKKWVAVDPPSAVATQLLEKGRWQFPKVAGVITTPTLRPDGTILDRPGYDPATQLWYSPDRGVVLPQLLEEPTREHAKQALKLLIDLLPGFPFEGDVYRSVALAAILTAVLRGAFDVIPMNLWQAPDVGSGKSYLTDLISIIARGQVCPVVTNVKSVEEMEKRLGALVLEGVQMVSLDNCFHDIGGELLCQITERRLIRIRILGKSEMPECEWRGMLHATGNNVTFLADMARRGLVGKLDAKVERPELRTFDFDPIERVLKDRGAYIAAAITIARAYITAGSPKVCGPLGSYEPWSRMVRSSLIWLGQEDPVKTMDEAREEDPERRAFHALIELWHKHLGLNTNYTTSQLIFHANALADPISEHGEEAEPQPELRDLFLQQAAAGPRNNIDGKILGSWLSSIRGRIHNRLYIDRVKERRAHGNKYALLAVPSQQKGETDD